MIGQSNYKVCPNMLQKRETLNVIMFKVVICNYVIAIF